MQRNEEEHVPHISLFRREETWMGGNEYSCSIVTYGPQLHDSNSTNKEGKEYEETPKKKKKPDQTRSKLFANRRIYSFIYILGLTPRDEYVVCILIHYVSYKYTRFCLSDLTLFYLYLYAIFYAL